MRADADIIGATLSGNREAFAELVQRHYPLVYALALASLRNRSDAEDAAQETFLRALKSLDSLKDRTSFAPWLSSIVRNICRNVRIKEVREERGASEATIAVSANETEPEVNELHALLWDHVMALPPDEREILILYYFSKHNTRAIAELLSISVPAAEKRLQRARQSLGTRMEAALNETMDHHRHRDRAVQQTALAVIACPVTWKPIAAPAAGIAGTAASILYSWKTIVALVAIGLIGGGYFLRDGFSPAPPAIPIHPATQIAETGLTTGEIVKPVSTVTKPAETKPGFFQVLARAIGRGPTGPTIHVVSVEDETKPIEGAQIAIFNEDDPSNILKGTTGADGDCVLSRVPPSGALLSVTHPDYRPQRRIPITLKRDESKTIALEPYKGVTLAGRVVEADTQQPVRSFSLQVIGIDKDMPSRWREGFAPYTSEDGHFEIDAGGAPTQIDVIAPGFALHTTNLTQDGIELENLLITLEPSYQLTVATVDEQDNPVAGAAISISPDILTGREEEEKISETTWPTDDRGYTVIEDIPVRPESVTARHNDYISCEMSLDRNPPSRNLAATIVMRKGVSVTGTVRLGNNPLSGASVSLRTAESERTRQSFRASGQSGENGVYALANVPAGNYELSSSLRGTSVRYNVKIDGLTPQTFDVTFPDRASDSRLARISGNVTINGEPARLIVAELQCEGDFHYRKQEAFPSAEVPDAGYYVIDDIVPGTINLDLSASDDSGLRVSRKFVLQVSPGADVPQNVDFTVGNAPITVHVTAPPQSQVSVTARNDENESTHHLILESGEGDIELNMLPAGPYTVSAQLPTPMIAGLSPRRGNNESLLRAWQPTTQPEPVERRVARPVWHRAATVETREGEVTRVEFTLGGTE